jgi:acyl-CoA dehydrogenase
VRASVEDPAWLTARHAAERDRIRGVLAREVAPHAQAWESQRFVGAEGWRALADAGLLSLPHDGEGFLAGALFLEELGGLGFAGVRASVAVHVYMASSYIARFGSGALRETYLPAVQSGRRIAALAMSEENAGSDLRHLTTRATWDDDAAAYRVQGTKLHVANGSQAGFFITLARTGDASGRGLANASLLVVDADAAGVTRTPEAMLGWHAADVCRIDFDDVLVPSEQLIGRPGRALMYIVEALDFERPAAGLLALGGASHALDVIQDRIREHRIGDTPLGDRQAVRHRFADLRAELATVRQYAYHAAWLHSTGRLDTRTASVLKLKATELAREAAHACAQLHGAYGYLEDTVPARLYRDAMAGTIAAGASELQRDLVFLAP